MKKIKTFVSQHFFYRQHPDTALRYLPIIKLLKEYQLYTDSILEIGSGSYGITPYLQRQITGVDTQFPEPEYPLLHQVMGSALCLPFSDNSFDVCLFSDVLEHLPEKDRVKAVAESLRVTKKYVIISGPFGQLSLGQDRKLAQYSDHIFFKEHLQYGLPDIESLINQTAKLPHVASVKLVNQSLNLSVRNFIMRIYLAGKFGYYFYLKGLMLFVPILKYLNFPPCYRAIILVTKEK